MTPEDRIIQFVELLKDSGAIKFYKDFYDKVGIRRQYVTSVKNKRNRFTSKQILHICQNYDINANWIFGTEDNIYRTESVYKKVHKT